MGNACTYNVCHTTIAIVINKRHTSHRINHSITQCDTHTHTLSLSLLCPYVCICFSFSSLNNFFFHFTRCIYFPMSILPALQSQIFSPLSFGYNSSTFSRTRIHIFFVIYMSLVLTSSYIYYAAIFYHFSSLLWNFVGKYTTEKRDHREKITRSAFTVRIKKSTNKVVHTNTYR